MSITSAEAEIIRERILILEERNRRDLLKEGFLECLTITTLEAIWNLQQDLEQILTNNSDKKFKIDKIRELTNNPEIKIKIEKVMEEIGAKRLEDLSIFADTILTLIETGEKS
jgi:hypothetical protein